MSRVLLVTTNYWPEPTGIAVYTTDLAEALKTKNNKVTVLTSLPHYPWWKVPTEFAHLGEGVTSHNGVEVIRAKHLVPPKMNALLRMRFEFSLWWNLNRVSKRFKNNDFDVVIACMPTVAAGVIGNKIAKKLKKENLVRPTEEQLNEKRPSREKKVDYKKLNKGL